MTEMKPHIIWVYPGLWKCLGMAQAGLGETPAQAYQDWQQHLWQRHHRTA